MSGPASHACVHPAQRRPFHQQWRQHCTPPAQRLPRWLQRVWAWF